MANPDVYIIILRQREREDCTSQVDVYLDKKISLASKLMGIFQSNIAQHFTRGKGEVNVYTSDNMSMTLFIETLTDIKSNGWTLFGTNAYMNPTTGEVVKTHYFEKQTAPAYQKVRNPSLTNDAPVNEISKGLPEEKGQKTESRRKSSRLPESSQSQAQKSAAAPSTTEAPPRRGSKEPSPVPEPVPAVPEKPSLAPEQATADGPVDSSIEGEKPRRMSVSDRIASFTKLSSPTASKRNSKTDAVPAEKPPGEKPTPSAGSPTKRGSVGDKIASFSSATQRENDTLQSKRASLREERGVPSRPGSVNMLKDKLFGGASAPAPPSPRGVQPGPPPVPTRAPPPLPETAANRKDPSSLTSRPLPPMPAESRPVIPGNTRRKKSVCSFDEVEEKPAINEAVAPSNEVKKKSLNERRLPDAPAPQVPEASQPSPPTVIKPPSTSSTSTSPTNRSLPPAAQIPEANRVSPEPTMKPALMLDTDDERSGSPVPKTASPPRALAPIDEGNSHLSRESSNAGETSPDSARSYSPSTRFMVGGSPSRRTLTPSQSHTAAKNAEYFKKLKEEQDFERRRKAEKESLMSPELLRKQKEAEEREKAHDTSKTNHYARLGSAFSTGALRGAGGRQSINLSGKGRGHPARG